MSVHGLACGFDGYKNCSCKKVSYINPQGANSVIKPEPGSNGIDMRSCTISVHFDYSSYLSFNLMMDFFLTMYIHEGDTLVGHHHILGRATYYGKPNYIEESVDRLFSSLIYQESFAPALISKCQSAEESNATGVREYRFTGLMKPSILIRTVVFMQPYIGHLREFEFTDVV